MALDDARHQAAHPRNALARPERSTAPGKFPATSRVRDGVRRAYSSAGLRGIWLGLLGTGLYRRLLVLERRLEQPPPVLDGEPAFCVVRLEDAAAYYAFRPDQELDQFARRRAEDATCFAAVAGERVVGATWARRGGGWCDYLERPVKLLDDDVYLFDTMVDPAWRGRRIAPHIAAAQIRFFRERGMSRLVAMVLPENRASLRARARSGFVVCGRIGWIGLGRRRHHYERLAASATATDRA